MTNDLQGAATMMDEFFTVGTFLCCWIIDGPIRTAAIVSVLA